MKISGAVFDVDGTLLDSMFMWDNIAIEYLNSMNIEPHDDLNEVIHSMSMEQVADYFRSEYQISLSPEELINGIDEMIEDFYFNDVQPKKNVIEFLNTLEEHEVKMCIVTATDRYLIEHALERIGILDYFGEIFTCSEVGSGKDDPQIFYDALDFLGTEYNSTWVFDDAYYAIETAKNAKFRVAAMFDRSSASDVQSIIKTADVCFKDFSEAEDFFYEKSTNNRRF